MTHRLEADAVLLDLDGVLVDSTAAVERQWRRFAGWYELEPGRVLEQIHGRRTIDTIGVLLARHPSSVRRAAYDRLQRLEVEDQQGVTALAGAVELLDALPEQSWAPGDHLVADLGQVRLERVDGRAVSLLTARAGGRSGPGGRCGSRRRTPRCP